MSIHGFNKISSDIRIYSVILAWWTGRRGRPEMTLLWVYMIRLTPSPITQHFLADATPLEKLCYFWTAPKNLKEDSTFKKTHTQKVIHKRSWCPRWLFVAAIYSCEAILPVLFESCTTMLSYADKPSRALWNRDKRGLYVLFYWSVICIYHLYDMWQIYDDDRSRKITLCNKRRK